MGNRLSTIATRTGDGGTTGLGDGSRVSKADLRVAAMGDIDELNSCVGLLIAFGVPEDPLHVGPLLANVQQDLLDLGGELSIPGYTLLRPERVAALDEWLRAANATLPRLQEFIRPGGSIPAAQAHVCRTVCRRAERSVVELAETQAVSNTVRQYLNRLSDLLFVLARVLNRSGGGAEHQWDRARNGGATGGRPGGNVDHTIFVEEQHK
jgi:cob(I)alamin adenosyltransferase